MTELLRAQNAFLTCLLDDDSPAPTGWTAKHAAGMAVYRNAYRTRLMDVLRATFERTARLVGDDAFNQAAVHHLITHPPKSWTIDLSGEGFAETCAQLFANDPDVGEVAWLEWAMHRAFTATDASPMTLADFATATADFDAGQWDDLRLTLTPGTALRPVTFDVVRLWEALAESGQAIEVARLPEPKWVLLWREGEQPVFGLISEAEAMALANLLQGGTFGSVCAGLSARVGEHGAADAAGAMLRGWLNRGILQGVLSSIHLP